jgi:hypothetical protein
MNTLKTVENLPECRVGDTLTYVDTGATFTCVSVPQPTTQWKLVQPKSPPCIEYVSALLIGVVIGAVLTKLFNNRIARWVANETR